VTRTYYVKAHRVLAMSTARRWPCGWSRCSLVAAPHPRHVGPLPRRRWMSSAS